MKKIGTQSEINALLKKNNFRVKKHFGQNFLIDQNILDNIVAKGQITKNTCVIEIGPGLGSLTEKLILAAKKVIAYEIDKDLIPILNDTFHEHQNFQLIHQDILNVDIDLEIDTYFPGESEIVVVSNLPYYITTPILMKFLETSNRVSRLILMMQLEVAQRIASKPNTKDYNALSVVIQYRANTSILFKVPKTVFIPAPNVDSAVIEISLKKEKTLSSEIENQFYDFAHFAFTQRRKTLVNNIMQAYPDRTRAEIESILSSLGMSTTIRAEAISLDEFTRLFKTFFDYK